MATPEKSAPPPPVIILPAVREIPLDQIDPSPWNRKRFNQTQLEELAASIVETKGVMQPIVLRPCPELVLRKSLVGEQHYIDVKGTKTGAEAYKNKEAAEAAMVTLQRYQIVAGERRWKASRIAREKLGFLRDTITASVRALTDAQAIKLTLIENAQREDVPVLELCRTYKFLLEQKQEDGSPYTREFIAAEVDKSYSLVCAILNADKAIKEVQNAAAEGKIGDSLVLEIAKYTPAQQMDIFLACFDEHSRMSLKAIEKDKDAETTVSVRQLRAWIAEYIHIELKNAPFDTKDEFLLKGVPSCVKCPKRTGSNPGLFAEAAEMKRGDICTDSGCYEAKKQAFVHVRIAEEQRKAAPAPTPAAATVHVPAKTAAGVKPLGAAFSQSAALARGKKAEALHAVTAAPVIEIQKISTESTYSFGYGGKQKQKGVLYDQDYNLAKPGCKKEKKAIYVDGPKIGQTAFICDVKSCTNHGYSGGSSYRQEVTPAERERRRKVALNLRIHKAHRQNLLLAVHGELPEKLGEAETRLLSEFMIERLDHDRVKRVVDFYAWEIKKKKSYGAEYTDWNGILETNVRKMSAAELGKFMLIAACSGDLQVNEYETSHKLGDNTMLGRVAKLYKLDSDAHLKKVRDELEKKAEKGKPAAVAKVQKPAVKKAKTDKTKKKK
jgi:ParB/RepB/Spo0J family partition protein